MRWGEVLMKVKCEDKEKEVKEIKLELKGCNQNIDSQELEIIDISKIEWPDFSGLYETQQTACDIFETIGTIAKQTQENMIKVLEPLYKIFEQTGEVVSKLIQLHENVSIVSQEISEKGWFIPVDFELSLRDIVQLKNLTAEELEIYFLQYYTENNQELMYKLLQDIQDKLDREIISPRFKGIMKECIDSYLDGRYLVAIVALCPIVEGILFDIFYNVKTKNADKSLMFKSMEKRIKEQGSSLEFSYLSAYNFIKIIFKFADFSAPEPVIGLNRHWILHGKSSYELKQIDAIKLFSLINTILIFQAEELFYNKALF